VTDFDRSGFRVRPAERFSLSRPLKFRFRSNFQPGHEVEHPNGDNYTRALPMSSGAQAGNIKLVRGRWNKEFLDELEQAGPDEKLYDHDDQWDAASSAFSHLAANRREPFSYTPVKCQTPQVEASSQDKDEPKFGKKRQLGTLIKSRRWGLGGY
jgi:hypothetical protein